MLSEIVDRDKHRKRIAVCTSSEAFTAILESLLRSWGVELCRRDDPSALLLAEEGHCDLMAGQNAIWLNRSDEAGPDRIRLPVSIETLWQVLELNFHRPAREHMRIAVQLGGRVLLRGEWFATRLSSLSDMGARFNTEQEMVRGEPVTIELEIDDAVWQYHGQIIFSMAVGAVDSGTFQSGVIFAGQNKETCDVLRSLLTRWHLEAIRYGMPRALFQDGLAFFDLTPEVVEALGALD